MSSADRHTLIGAVGLVLVACASPDLGPCAPGVYEARLAVKEHECEPRMLECEPYPAVCPAEDECNAWAAAEREKCLR